MIQIDLPQSVKYQYLISTSFPPTYVYGDKSFHSYRNLCDIQCASETTSLHNISVSDLP